MFLENPPRWLAQQLTLSEPGKNGNALKGTLCLVLLTVALVFPTVIEAQDDPPIQARIVGGAPAEEGSWPSIVALVSAGDAPIGLRQMCAGSVVADRWVLTAGHCMFNEDGSPTVASQIRVVAGINDLRDATAVETVVTNIFLHPDYDNTLFPVNDIALLELGTSVDVPQNSLSAVDPESLVGTTAFIAGWGALAEEGPPGTNLFPNLLQDASLPLVSLEQCNMPESYDGFLANTQMCAGFREGGVDACQGDSGGPIYVMEGDRQVQVGVTSFGAGCARPNFYGVYTNVDAFRPWMSNYFDLSGNGVAENSLNTVAKVTVGDGVVAGSTHPLSIITLAGFTFFLFLRTSLSRGRRMSGLGSTSVSDRGHISVNSGRHMSTYIFSRSRRLFILVATLLSAAACSSNLPLPEDATTDKAISSESNSTVKKSNEDFVSTSNKLSLSADNNNVGVNQLLLRSTRSEFFQGLSKSGFDEPACVADKTSIKGTGRLFLRERCQAQPLGLMSLEGAVVDGMTFQILDDRLIKLEMIISSSDNTTLTKQLDDLYQHAPSNERLLEWRSGNDHIRIVTSSISAADGSSAMALQMIDGRLKDKLPALFEYP